MSNKIKDKQTKPSDTKKLGGKKWLLLGLSVAATGALSYFGFQYWKKNKQSSEDTNTDIPESNQESQSTYSPLKTKPKTQKPVEAPDYFLAAIKKNKKAWATFEKFSPSNKKDYIEWSVDAKSEETRASRMKQAIEWMAEGKPRNWKYMKEYL